MIKNANVSVLPPQKCPACSEDDTYGNPFGKPMLITIEDPHMEAKWLILKGWVCGKFAYGSVVRHGPLPEPVDIISEDHVYDLTLPDRTYYI